MADPAGAGAGAGAGGAGAGAGAATGIHIASATVATTAGTAAGGAIGSLDPMVAVTAVDPLRLILLCLDSRSLLAAQRVSRKWATVVQSEDSTVWAAACWRDWRVETPTLCTLYHTEPEASDAGDAPSTTPTFPTFRAAWYANTNKFHRYRNCFARMFDALNTVVSFIESVHPGQLELLPGLTDGQLDDFEARIKFSLVPELRCLYRFFGGQTPSFMGLFGGYSFYDHFATMIMVPIGATRSGLRGTKFIAIASNAFSHVVRRILVHATTGHVYFGPFGTEQRSAYPADTADSTLLPWLEEYARRVRSGMYKPSRFPEEYIGRPDAYHLSLFSCMEGSDMVSANTNGIIVQASPLYIPERSSTYRGTWAYRIRVFMLPECPIPCCQLWMRRWEVRDADTLQVVEGEGVIGQFPVLRPGSEPFEYESCTQAGTSVGENSMGGVFRMIPGTLADRAGEPFDVVVPKFHLRVPAILY